MMDWARLPIKDCKIAIIWGPAIPEQLLPTQKFIQITCYCLGDAHMALYLYSNFTPVPAILPGIRDNDLKLRPR